MPIIRSKELVGGEGGEGICVGRKRKRERDKVRKGGEKRGWGWREGVEKR